MSPFETVFFSRYKLGLPWARGQSDILGTHADDTAGAAYLSCFQAFRQNTRAWASITHCGSLCGKDQGGDCPTGVGALGGLTPHLFLVQGRNGPLRQVRHLHWLHQPLRYQQGQRSSVWIARGSKCPGKGISDPVGELEYHLWYPV